MRKYQNFVKLLPMDGAQGVRERISSLKQYIRQIEEKIPTTQPQQKFTPVWKIPNRAVVSAPPSEISIQLLKQIQQLTERIERKKKRLGQQTSNTQRILKGPGQTLPFIASCYISKVTPQGSLNSIVNKIEAHQWKKCSIYTKKNLLVLVLDPSLEVLRLDLLTLRDRHVSPSAGFIKLITACPDYFIILSIPDQSMLHMWSSYLRSFQIFSRNSDPISSKWQTTSIKCRLSSNNKHQEQEESEEDYRINIKNQKMRLKDSGGIKQKKQLSVSFKEEAPQIEQLPLSEIKKKRLSSNSSLKSQGKVLRSSLGKKEEKMNYLVLKKTISQDSKESGQALLKLEQKRKRLIEEGRLNIHWDQQEDRYHDNFKERGSIRPKNTSRKSNSNMSKDNLKISSNDSKKDGRSLEAAEKKRHDSQTRGELDSRLEEERSMSRGGKTQIYGSRKYVPFSSNQFPDFSEQNPGSSTKKKHSIQREVLKKTMAKNSPLIKEQQSKSSETKNIEKKIEASIKQKSQKVHFSKQEASRAIFLERNEDNYDDDSYESSDSGASSEFSQMDLHQLESGIVLWKCSPNGWKPHQKKLYLAKSELELCYCDIMDARQEKKFFIRDILEVKQGNEGIGIIKHFGNVDVERCLMITINLATESNKEKKKCLEFYLGENQAPENLKDFTKKLKAYLEMKKRGEEEEDYLEDDQ